MTDLPQAEKCEAKGLPGVCVPWEDRKALLSEIQGDEEIVKQIHENIDGLASMYVWQILLSF